MTGFDITGRAFPAPTNGAFPFGPSGGGSDSFNLPNGTGVSAIEAAESFENTYGNYTEQVGGGSINPIELEPVDGSYSMQFYGSGDQALTHDNTSGSSVAEGAVQTYFKLENGSSGTNTFAGAVFRYQDSNNYYVATYEPGVPDIGLFKIVGGTFERVNRTSVSYQEDLYANYRFQFYVENTDLKYTLQYEDGSSWTDIGTVSDPANDLSGGGGIGFGDLGGSDGISKQDYYIDLTKVYTPSA